MRGRYWVLNLLSGLAVFALLGWHMAVMHLNDLLGLAVSMPVVPLAWDQVLERGRSAAYAGTYVLLLGTALFHGFYGLHTILKEYWPGRVAGNLITACCWIAGGALFAVGTYATIAFRSASLVP